MTNAPSTSSSVGCRGMQALRVNADDLSIRGSTAAWYYGLMLEGINSLELTIPEHKRVIARGEDSIITMFTLAPEELVTGKIAASKKQSPMVEMLTGAKDRLNGETRFQWHATNNQGYENDVCVLGYQMAQDTAADSTAFGAEGWLGYMIPLCKLIPQPGGMNENVNQTGYILNARPTNKYPWGIALNNSDDGVLRGQFATIEAVGRPIMAGAVGDNSTTAFPFDTKYPALSTAKIKLYSNAGGTWAEVAAGITKATTGITYNTAPGTGVRLVVFYEF